MRKKFPKKAKESETVLMPSVRSPTRETKYTTITYEESLGQIYADSLVAGSVSLSPCEPGLAGFVSFLVESRPSGAYSPS